jgi:hypothetical protein
MMEKPKSDDRVKDRFSYDKPELVSVKCRIDKGSEEGKVCVLNVFDSSQSGIALLIAPKDADLVEFIEVGDKICDMSFFGIGAQIKHDGIVRHITQITEGKYKGYHIVGIEAQDV